MLKYTIWSTAFFVDISRNNSIIALGVLVSDGWNSNGISVLFFVGIFVRI